MTGKRFKLIGDNNLEFLIQHKLELPIYDYQNDKKRLSLKDTLDLLNSFNDENEQLKIKNQKQENLINSQKKVIEGLENWFEKWGFDAVNYQILDQIMKHFLEGDIK